MNEASGRTALVTGANRGIGLEVCRQLRDLGYSVILTARDAKDGEAAARKLGVAFHQLDVTDPESVATLVADLGRDGTAIDVLVNNAAVSLNGFDGTVVRNTLSVNFFGALAVTEAILPLMPEGGSIVMVASGMGELNAYAPTIRACFAASDLTRDQLIVLVDEFVAAVDAGEHQAAGWPSSAYRVSKTAMIALTKQMARALAPRGIRVNAVCPGWVRTRMGGAGASRGVAKGAASVVWAATLSDETTGGFFRDGKPANW